MPADIFVGIANGATTPTPNRSVLYSPIPTQRLTEFINVFANRFSGASPSSFSTPHLRLLQLGHPSAFSPLLDPHSFPSAFLSDFTALFLLLMNHHFDQLTFFSFRFSCLNQIQYQSNLSLWTLHFFFRVFTFIFILEFPVFCLFRMFELSGTSGPVRSRPSRIGKDEKIKFIFYRLYTEFWLFPVANHAKSGQRKYGNFYGVFVIQDIRVTARRLCEFQSRFLMD